ncbi:MAG: hypothetical protein WCJ59_03430, partial [bacterium]
MKFELKNNKDGFVIPLIIAIIALLTAGGGTYVYVNKIKPNLNSNSKSIQANPNPKTEKVGGTLFDSSLREASKLSSLNWTADQGIMVWSDANKACSEVGGRLPTRDELKNAISNQFVDKGDTPGGFDETKMYWSSTDLTSEIMKKNNIASNAYYIVAGHIKDHSVDSMPFPLDTPNVSVRCVSGEVDYSGNNQTINSAITPDQISGKAEDVSVTPDQTKSDTTALEKKKKALQALVWTVLPKEMNWKDAISACAAIGSRLPKEEEFLDLMTVI